MKHTRTNEERNKFIESSSSLFGENIVHLLNMFAYCDPQKFHSGIIFSLGFISPSLSMYRYVSSRSIDAGGLFSIGFQNALTPHSSIRIWMNTFWCRTAADARTHKLLPKRKKHWNGSTKFHNENLSMLQWWQKHTLARSLHTKTDTKINLFIVPCDLGGASSSLHSISAVICLVVVGKFVVW